VPSVNKGVCIALLAVGLVGSWYASFKLIEMLDEWRGHIRGPVVERSLRRIPKDKLEALPKESLIVLVESDQLVRGAEHHYSETGYTYLLVTSAIAVASNLTVTLGALCGLLVWRKSRRKVGQAEAQSGSR
jgi:hypothetical protein